VIQLSLRISQGGLSGDKGVVIVILVLEDVIGELGVDVLELSQL